MKNVLLGMIGVVISNLLYGQQSDGIADGSFIRENKNTWEMISKRPDLPERRIGAWSDDIKFDNLNGKKVIIRTQVSVTIGGWSKIINIVDAKTLHPISGEITDAQGGINSVKYFDGKVLWKHSTGNADKIEEKEIPLTEPVYDYAGGMYGMTLIGFPLAMGYKTKFASFNPDSGKQEWVAISVDGEETIQAGPNKQVKTWVVTVNGNDPSGNFQKFYITKQAPYVIKLIDFNKVRILTFNML